MGDCWVRQKYGMHESFTATSHFPGALVTPPKDLECLVKSRKDNGVLCIHKSKQKNQTADFLSGPVMKNPPCNAGDAGSIPSRGTKSPHASKQLSPSALEPACHN